MAHNIAQINGKYAFFGTQAAWHRLGQVVDGAQTWEQAMNLAQLNWTVEKTQLVSPYTGEPISAYGTFRSDTKQLLGVVGEGYSVIENRFAFDFVDTILSAENGAHYEAAGALGNGEKIWCLAKINGETDITGTGDVHKWYLLFCTSHDGSLATTVKVTNVRVVCQNTMTQALNMQSTTARIRHTKNANEKLTLAKSLLANAVHSVHDVEEKLRELSKRVVSKESFSNVMKKLFGDFEESTRAKNKVLEVAGLYDFNDGNQFPEIRGTAYNLLNAVTEYTDHKSGIRRTESRQGSTDEAIRAENALFGTGADMKEKAVEVIYELTAGDKRREVIYHSVSQPVTNEPPVAPSFLDEVISNTVLPQ